MRLKLSCPACGNRSLDVDDDGNVICTWTGCPDPVTKSAIDQLIIERAVTKSAIDQLIIERERLESILHANRAHPDYLYIVITEPSVLKLHLANWQPNPHYKGHPKDRCLMTSSTTGTVTVAPITNPGE